ncbi:response regulator [Pelagibacterium sp.]|uniref:response regulator n=1 Tax=Pelagibacterium sp. TaxID=1967288 RepID=UPI003A8DE130
MSKQRIVIVDDHPIFRSGLTQTLELEPDFDVVAQGESGTEAIVLAGRHRPDMLLLDVAMATGGVDVIPDVLKVSPNTLVVMLTASTKVNDVSRSLDLGAVSYLLKGTTARELLNAVKEIFDGRVQISPRLLGDLISQQQIHSLSPEQEAIAKLTDQEARVLRLVSQGFSNAEIGRTLEVQEKTVKFHLSNIFEKLAVRNRVEAALLAQRVWRDAGG